MGFTQHHRAVLTGPGVKQGAWEEEELQVRSCFPAAQQNTADTSGSGSILKSQLGPILEKILGADSSLLCGWDLMGGTAAMIQSVPKLCSFSTIGWFCRWLCIRHPLFQEPNVFYCQGEASLSHLMRSLTLAEHRVQSLYIQRNLGISHPGFLDWWCRISPGLAMPQ